MVLSSGPSFIYLFTYEGKGAEGIIVLSSVSSSNLPSRSRAHNRGHRVSLESKKPARGRHLKHVGIVGMSDKG